ncbi:MAG: hypothetical protein OJF49_002888 [Ktedonobacterales bacterium]|jgi:multisubunit Na+/H+ antiporter MnhC subunit|nr:MAG: hypothetical protein OJF49_002888 [Ktedonobacterales bacterium]
MPSYLRTLYLIEVLVPPLLIALALVLTRDKRTSKAIMVMSLLSLGAGIVYVLLTARSAWGALQDFSSSDAIPLSVAMFVAESVAAILVLAAWILCLHDAAQHHKWWWFGGLVVFALITFVLREPVLVFTSTEGPLGISPSRTLMLASVAIGFSLPIGTLIYSLRGRRYHSALPDGVTASSVHDANDGLALADDDPIS